MTSPFRAETGAVESFRDRLVPVNIHPPASNVCFVFFHLFGGSLMNSRPGSTKAVAILKSGFSFFETAGHIDYSQSVFVCFSAPAMPPVEGKEGLPGERRLVLTHLIWGEECVLA